MLSPKILLMVFGLHLLLMLIYLLVHSFTGITHLRKDQFLPIFFIPGFGLLVGLGIELLYLFKKENQKEVDMEEMKLGTDIYWKTLQKSQANFDLVPLEEAIHINDFKIRRKLLLDTLFKDPSKHLDILMVARHNEDAETAHYAATTIDKIQRDFQLKLQKYADLLKEQPEDEETLEKYINILQKYLESGLLERYLLERQRVIFANILKKSFLSAPRKETLIKILQNSLALKDFDAALEAGLKLRQNWPEDEDTWIESLRACVEARDYKVFQQVISQIREANIDWTPASQKQIKFWTNHVTGRSFQGEE